MTTTPNALGVYIFAGGFSLGIEKHFNILAHFEDGPFGTATVRLNRPDIPIFTNVPAWPADDLIYQRLPLIYGNPPCAPWSTAGNLVNQKTKLANAGIGFKWEADPRVECVRRQFALLERLAPTMWVWESVAAAYSRGATFIADLAQRANDRGYAVTRVLVNGKWTGLPQERRRFFFVAHRVELPWAHPGKSPPTVGEVIALNPDAAEEHPDSKAKITGSIVNYIGDIEQGKGAIDAFNRWKEREHLPLELNKHGHVRGRPNFLCHRLHPGKPSGTIVSGTCLVHPHHDRFLTVKETQLLSGYPADYVFVGRDAYSQISKAVLPPVADWLGGILRAGYDAGVPVTEFTVRDVNFMKGPQP